MLFLLAKAAASPRLPLCIHFCCSRWTAGFSDSAFYLDGSFGTHFVNSTREKEFSYVITLSPGNSVFR